MINWARGYKAIWSKSCDFNGNNIVRKKSKAKDCEFTCRLTSGCTHYSWFDGWCYAKTGLVKKNDAVVKSGMVCGILDEALRTGKTKKTTTTTTTINTTTTPTTTSPTATTTTTTTTTATTTTAATTTTNTTSNGKLMIY